MIKKRLTDSVDTESSLPDILLKGITTHNLQNITVRIPRNRFVVLTGVSGSGKSSLAFDTLYAEGHRRYVESLSAYVRQFLERMPRPEIESVEGIAPAIAIEQKPIPKNPRSTVGTVSEIYDYLRLLYARIGKIYSADTNELVLKHTPDDVGMQAGFFEEGTKFYAGFPFPSHRDSSRHACPVRDEMANLKKKGFFRLVSGDVLLDLNDVEAWERVAAMRDAERGSLLVLVDRFVTRHDEKFSSRVAQAAESCFAESGGYAILKVVGKKPTGSVTGLSSTALSIRSPLPSSLRSIPLLVLALHVRGSDG